MESTTEIDQEQSKSNEFQHRLDVEYILSNKRHLQWGIHAGKAYTTEVESKRHMLRPILRAARQIPGGFFTKG